MSFGQNLQCLRKMRNRMTQEELAERIGVSRQTISKWELDQVYPEMDKAMELCDLFSCSMDELMRGDLVIFDNAYSDIRTEIVKPFHYIKYAVISREPEEDAINHVQKWAEALGRKDAQIIGWDFPFVTQEQINVCHMHGYEAALILGDEMVANLEECPEILYQEEQKYIAITIKDPTVEPFRLIPNAYKALMTYMQMNGVSQKNDKKIISCFEKEYVLDGIPYMDVYIAIK